jgi:hypothetical protein
MQKVFLILQARVTLALIVKGMFLYAEVVLRSMDSLDDMGEIREELRVLPESLNAA